MDVSDLSAYVSRHSLTPALYFRAFRSAVDAGDGDWNETIGLHRRSLFVRDLCDLGILFGSYFGHDGGLVGVFAHSSFALVRAIRICLKIK
jgi:hypothetical protein